MTMASLTASLLARKGHAQPSATARDIFAPKDVLVENRWQSPTKAETTAPGKSADSRVPAANEQDCSAFLDAAEQKSPRSVLASVEARHTRLAHSGEVAPQKDPAPAIKATATKPGAKERKHKSLRIDSQTDLQLRLLAARLGTSQQSLMERALKKLLTSETQAGRCICGSGRE